MRGWGTAAGGDGGIVVTVSGEDWSILLRRADLKPDARFAPYYGNPVGASDVALFLPHWRALQWKNVPDSLLGRAEVCAVDGEFEVTVSAAGAGAKRHQDLVRAFLRFMAA
jgi:hypothetical protein